MTYTRDREHLGETPSLRTEARSHIHSINRGKVQKGSSFFAFKYSLLSSAKKTVPPLSLCPQARGFRENSKAKFSEVDVSEATEDRDL